MADRIRTISRRYGRLMQMCRWLARLDPTDAQRYNNLRHCLWARCTRELRHAVMRH